MTTLEITLAASTILCSMVTGFLFAFAVVVMPGIKAYDDALFLKTFQVTDGVIQRKHPLFMGLWVGSVLAIVPATILGSRDLMGEERVLLIVAAALYLFGVQLVTAFVHIPRNNRVQSLKLDELSEDELRAERAAFEGPWNRSNQRRTFVAFVVSVILTYLTLAI